jgi:adenine/guanine phosphoribosyltransferase-like PRPP-binding protein
MGLIYTSILTPKQFNIMSKQIVVSSYASDLFDRNCLKNRIKEAKALIKKNIKKTGIQPTGIVSTGISGNTFASILAYELDLDLVIVRKAGESSHASKRVEGLCIGDNVENRLIIVDDFIDTGDTIKRIILEVNKADNAWHDTKQEYLIPSVQFLYGILYGAIGDNNITTADNISVTLYGLCG